MNLPIKPSAIELQHLEQVLASAGWALIVRKMETMGTQATLSALKAKTWDETLVARGKLEGLTLAVRAPQILLEEINEQLKQEGK
jgi:hypothetical protein